tara:strand:- start:557 stop:775 length:219 start_codon:yes stop_codon:yes gene_type:complete
MIARNSAKRCYTPIEREYFCNSCNQTFTQVGRGKLRKTCPDCLESKKSVGTSYSLDVDDNNEAKQMLEELGL